MAAAGLKKIRTRNMALALAQDRRYGKLQMALKVAEKEGRIKVDEPQTHALFLQVWKDVMQQIAGSHISILNSQELFN